MLHDIPSLFSDEREQYEDELPEDVLYGYSDMCEETYFSNVERYPAYRIEDIDDIINYYFITGALPKYCTFPDREKFDVGVLAKHIVDNNLNRTEETEYIKEKWNSEKDEWMTFFDFKEKNFRREISLALDRLLHPEDYEVKVVTPEETFETRAFEDLTLMQIREKDPRYERWLRNKVFEKYTNSEGYYYSAQSGYRSKKRLDFEIDHIIPISRGGKTNLNNLQLLTRAENKLKGDKM